MRARPTFALAQRILVGCPPLATLERPATPRSLPPVAKLGTRWRGSATPLSVPQLERPAHPGPGPGRRRARLHTARLASWRLCDAADSNVSTLTSTRSGGPYLPDRRMMAAYTGSLIHRRGLTAASVWPAHVPAGRRSRSGSGPDRPSLPACRIAQPPLPASAGSGLPGAVSQ